MDKIESKQFEIEQKNVLGDMCEIDTGYQYIVKEYNGYLYWVPLNYCELQNER